MTSGFKRKGKFHPIGNHRGSAIHISDVKHDNRLKYTGKTDRHVLEKISYEGQKKLDNTLKERFKNQTDEQLRKFIQNTRGNDDDQMYELKRRGREWKWVGNTMVFTK